MNDSSLMIVNCQEVFCTLTYIATKKTVSKRPSLSFVSLLKLEFGNEKFGIIRESKPLVCAF